MPDFIRKFSRNFVDLAFVASLICISENSIRSWVMDPDEYSITIIRCGSTWFLETSALSLIIQRRCNAHDYLLWCNTVTKNGARRKLTEAEKKHVAMSQQWRCAHCKEIFTNYEVDHVEMHACRANDRLTNLQALCPNCHSSKSRRDNLFTDALFQTRKPMYPENRYQ